MNWLARKILYRIVNKDGVKVRFNISERRIIEAMYYYAAIWIIIVVALGYVLSILIKTIVI
jgi:hypothetical protein